MLPGVELARKRRVHCHRDMHIMHRQVLPDPNCGRSAAVDRSDSDMSEHVLLARMRLEEKLRRFSGPNTSSSRRKGSSKGIVDGAAAQAQAQAQQRAVMDEASLGKTVRLQRRDSRADDVCAVCLDDFQAQQSITSLPCSHKYHSDCLLPWLAAHSHCPYCRTPVPQISTFS